MSIANYMEQRTNHRDILPEHDTNTVRSGSSESESTLLGLDGQSSFARLRDLGDNQSQHTRQWDDEHLESSLQLQVPV